LKFPSPAVFELGDRLLNEATGLFTVKFNGVLVSDIELRTVTGIVPAVAISAALMLALTCVASTNVVVLSVPPKLMVNGASLEKSPSTVRVKAPSPAVAVEGDKPLNVGAANVTELPTGLNVANRSLTTFRENRSLPSPPPRLISISGR
jgi:hypothetical protein